MEILTLVKLDSGDYINTNYVTRLGHRYGKLKCDPEQSETLSLSNRDDDEWISITPADKARIVEAMGGINAALSAGVNQDGLKPFSADDFKVSDKP